MKFIIKKVWPFNIEFQGSKVLVQLHMDNEEGKER
jgi:hypothetical protein